MNTLSNPLHKLLWLKKKNQLSPLEAKISQEYRVNKAVEDEQLEIEVRLKNN